MTELQSAPVGAGAPGATRPIHYGHMTKEDIGKARWARARAASLWQQADALDMDCSGDWRARAQRSRGASRLRVEAARFDSIASRLELEQEDQAA